MIPLTLGIIYGGSRIQAAIIAGLNAEIATSENRGLLFFIIQCGFEISIVLMTLFITWL